MINKKKISYFILIFFLVSVSYLQAFNKKSSKKKKYYPTPPNLSHKYEISWNDEFDGKHKGVKPYKYAKTKKEKKRYASIDSSKWARIPWYANDYANERFLKIDTSYGYLNLTIDIEDGKYPKEVEKLPDNQEKFQIGEPIKGNLASYNFFNQMFGYWEARIKTHDVTGFWTAFWMQPSLIFKSGPLYPEIDIVEYLFNKKQAQFALHTHFPVGGVFDHKLCVGHKTTIRGGWHTFGVEITPYSIIAYIDEESVLTIDLTKYDNFNYLVPTPYATLIYNSNRPLGRSI